MKELRSSFGGQATWFGECFWNAFFTSLRGGGDVDQRRQRNTAATHCVLGEHS